MTSTDHGGGSGSEWKPIPPSDPSSAPPRPIAPDTRCRQVRDISHAIQGRARWGGVGNYEISANTRQYARPSPVASHPRSARTSAWGSEVLDTNKFWLLVDGVGDKNNHRWSCLPSLALLLLLGVASPARADQLSDDMATLNARWDAAINGADFDALLPMYSSDAELMPPGTRPVTGSVAIRSFFAARGTSVRDHHLQLASVVAFGNAAMPPRASLLPS